MKARIWKDQATGEWRFSVHGRGGPERPIWIGCRPTWQAVLSELLPELYPPRTGRM